MQDPRSIYIIACRHLIWKQNKIYTSKQLAEQSGFSQKYINRSIRIARLIPPNQYNPKISIYQYEKIISKKSPKRATNTTKEQYYQSGCTALRLYKSGHTHRNIASTMRVSPAKIKELILIGALPKELIMDPKVTVTDLRQAIKEKDPQQYLTTAIIAPNTTKEDIRESNISRLSKTIMFSSENGHNVLRINLLTTLKGSA